MIYPRFARVVGMRLLFKLADDETNGPLCSRKVSLFPCFVSTLMLKNLRSLGHFPMFFGFIG